MSGFKISTEALRPEFYQVVLTLSGGTGSYPTADGTNNGAVCPQDHSAFATKPTTLALGRRVARAHLRFMNIVDAVSRFADAQIQDVQFTSSGATVADNQALTVTFTIRYDRAGAAVTVNTTAKALRYLIGQAILLAMTKRVRVYDGAQGAEIDESITIAAPDTIADIYDDVAVTLVDAAETIDS